MTHRRGRVVAIASVLLVAGVLSACGPRQPWQSELVSVNADGTSGGNGYSGEPVVSPDGTKVAFSSDADDLGPTDTNEASDVYVRDLVAGTTSLVSVNAAGTDSGNGGSGDMTFSPDGTKLAFSSGADDLAPGDVNDATDAFVRDLSSGTTTLISRNAAGTGSGNGRSFAGDFSPDGTKVELLSYADDLGPTDTNATGDVYLRDLVAGTTTLVSANAAGNDSASGASIGSSFSPDGTKFVLASEAGDLGPTDTNGRQDVYVRDLVAGTTTLVSAKATGDDSGNDASNLPVWSPDGTKVAFHSDATDLVPTDTNRNLDVFVRDLVAGTTTLVSANAGGTDSAGAVSAKPVFSPDGTKVAFESFADDLGPTDKNQSFDVYVRDLLAETTTLASADIDGTDAGDGATSRPQFAPDSRRIVFVSQASSLVAPGESNRSLNVYIATLRGADLSLVGDAQPDPVEPGGAVTYRFELANRGPDAAEDATVAVLLPQGVSFVGVATTFGECAEPGVEAPELVVCRLGELPVDAAGEVTITGSVEAPAGTPLMAIGAVSAAPSVDPVHNNDVAIVASAVGDGA